MDASPVADLKHEHSYVGMVVAAMEREAAHIRGSGEVDADAVRRMVEFTREFTDGCHHGKEEQALFPRLLVRSDQSRSVVAVMLKEHEAGRMRVRAIAGDLEPASRGDRDAALRVAANLESYSALLTGHIAKENNVLFPLADKVLDDQDKSWLAAEFERVEHEEIGAGGHARLEALAQELALEADQPHR
jgi:hemerythrin-like domain-containing protein